MAEPLLVVRSRRVVTDIVAPAAIHVRAGRIERVAAWDDVPAGARLDDAGELAVLPGIVDTHVHLNEPGRTEWEGFATATRAAAIGGVTTLVDMPLNSIPPTTTCEALSAKRAAAAGQCAVDVGFWGGVVPGNAGELAGLVADGVRGFKCFLVDSGVEEFGWVGEAELAPAMAILAGLGAPLLVHAEVAGPIDAAAAGLAGADPRRYATYLASRPPAAEEQAIALVTRLCRATGARTHIVHHSAASALDQLRAARADGLPLTAETCPHYLHFTAEAIPDGATPFKCAPPIRDAANREALWRALAEGVLDLVASDHSPCSPGLKAIEAGDFVAAWGGVAGLQLALSVVWTEACARGHSLVDVARWMSAGPARLAGLGAKGAIAAGRDADLVVFDDAATATVTAASIHHRHRVTPYAGETLRGQVAATYLRGQRIAEAGRALAGDLGTLL
ncbi:MAG: allantoinase AllB [Deltaproteobacteria bacterium]|nr:MAG: allantoinase AllB [Deltaproteobacteria bacterium]TMQ07068.1 MAG: allantoinase AllB [Deltaproteobacteria bacterium]